MASFPGIFCGPRFKLALALALFNSILLLAVMGLLEQSFRRSLVRESNDKGTGIARGVAFMPRALC